jgi:heme exporter protein A
VFSGLSFAVGAGEALVVSGPNGVGKSSLLRVIAGLVRRTGGELELEGGDPELTIGEQAHYLGHQDALKPSLSVAENLTFWSRYLGSGQAPSAALAAVGLDGIADLPAGYLSAGQRRRLSIARLIAVDRPLWLLDEPTSALDAAAQAHLAGFMARHLAGGGLILAAAHGPIGLAAAQELRLGVRQ